MEFAIIKQGYWVWIRPYFYIFKY